MNEQKIKNIHQQLLGLKYKIGAVVTGGGAGIFTKLLALGGTSTVFEELNIPYGASSNRAFMQNIYLPSYCSEAAVILLASQQAKRLIIGKVESPMVVACTASLYTEGQREGRINRAWVCIATNDKVQVCEHIFDWQNRARQEEELESIIISAIINPCYYGGKIIYEGRLSNFIQFYQYPYATMAGSPRDYRSIVLCGAFNPWHKGHQACLDMVHQRLPKRTNFVIELSAVNAEKGIIYPDEIKRRIETLPQRLGFFDQGGYECSYQRKIGTAATFVDKLNIYENPTFVVGTDTMMRIGDPKYYRDYYQAMQKLADGCDFFVLLRGHSELEVRERLPSELYNKCVFADIGLSHISSTGIRDGKQV